MKKYTFILIIFALSQAIESPYSTSTKHNIQESLQALTNPFKHNDSGQNLQLKAIVNNKVLLNQEWHKLGDVVEGYTIIALHPQAIILQKSSSRFKLSFNGELEKLEP